MLVLQRREGERLVIEAGGRTIFVLVAAMDGGRVRLGVEAPADVRVDREEVAVLRNARLYGQEELEGETA